MTAVVAAVVLTPAAAASAHTTEAVPRTANGGVLNCRTWVDGYKGFADCTNNTQTAVAFRATIVCGVWPDTNGQWITLNPGQRGTSEGECGGGTGAGSANWQEG
ncbi:hypothetical protein OG978_42240 (plasmid) [Streptomyces sp. NBC_01591]|uniref:hypothetical protein n=1 Tax=Streptomyces sp. NBC_01591 TaxID=2975888 RepID=UPI002DDB38A0|nr:hypothetical protein [Streptomyces sp. NBC_01591]WSD73816.1 hypothetical protein OG978_42240 [Streptomyces sp. NBC_01591]